MNKINILKMIRHEHERISLSCAKLRKKRYCGDLDERDQVTHDIAYLNGIMEGLYMVHKSIKNKKENA
jgi:hypothetical protein